LIVRGRLASIALLCVAACAPGEPKVDAAQCGSGAGDPQEEIHACDEMRRLFGEGNRGDSSVLSWRAKARERAGDSAGALADYDAALEINPNSGGALLGRGRLLLEAGAFEAAERTLLRSIEVHDSGIARDLLGGQALLRGDYQEALNYYEAAMETDWAPGPNATALYGRGVARLRLGDEGGREDIALAIRTYPTIAESFEERGIRP
jgi:tetratricopeptide (TPR) repeat protein